MYMVLAAIVHSSSAGITKTFCGSGQDWSEFFQEWAGLARILQEKIGLG